MKPSEKLKLIKFIADALGKEDWALIDLTLKQFGLPFTDNWNGSGTANYVIDMIGDASPVQIMDLAKHLGVASELDSIESPKFWKPNQPRVFISHLAKFKVQTTNLKTELARYGIVGFVAHEDIEPTKQWQSEIELGLSTMDALIALLTPEFNESKWTDQEIGVAIGRQVPIVPVRIGLDPYGFIGKYQAIQGKGKDTKEVAREIYEALISKPVIGHKITSELVKIFSESHSWANAKENMELLEMSPHFTPELGKKLVLAMKENSQIRNAWGVPERIEELLEKISS
jgi:hypothetical protein